jgi:hypothetical protein
MTRSVSPIRKLPRIARIDARPASSTSRTNASSKERKLVEIEAAPRALEQQLAQTRSGFERQVRRPFSISTCVAAKWLSTMQPQGVGR